MSRYQRFGLGGLGGLLPVLATLVAVDLSSIATLVDGHGITEGLCVGYAIRVLGLFALGGIVAAVNVGVTDPLALIQIGIAAPALVTSYLAGTEINKNPPPTSHASMIVSTAYAGQSMPSSNLRIAGLIDDVFQGIKPGFGVSPDAINPKAGKIIDNGNTANISTNLINTPLRVVSTKTNVCLDVPAKEVSSSEQLASLLQSFPSPAFNVEAGACPKQ